MTDLKKSESKVAQNRQEVVSTLCNFLPTDTLLFWSNEEGLQNLQQKQWQPLLNILEHDFSFSLQTTKDLCVPNNSLAKKVYNKHLNTLSDKELTACYYASTVTKSVLLGLLMAKNKISAAEAFKAAFLEELYQNEFWGKDEMLISAQESIKSELEQIAEYLRV